MKKSSGLSRRLIWILIIFLPQSLLAQTLQELVKQTKAKMWWDPYHRVALLITDSHKLMIDPRTKIALGDGKIVFDLEQVTLNDKGLQFNAKSFQQLIAWLSEEPKSLLNQSHPNPKSRVQVIVIDAGHGGLDSGSVVEHVFQEKKIILQEKKLTLQIALELEKLLKQAYPNKTIVMTRKKDVFSTLEERVRLAHDQQLEEKESIIFLSLHFNSSINKNAKGLEFWHVPQNYEREVISEKDVSKEIFPIVNALVDAEFKKESRKIALALATALGQELGQENVQRGLKEKPWFVVRMTRMPAVLVELGFLTNFEEAKKLTSLKYLKKLSKGLYHGIHSFIQNYERDE